MLLKIRYDAEKATRHHIGCSESSKSRGFSAECAELSHGWQGNSRYEGKQMLVKSLTCEISGDAGRDGGRS